MEVTAQVGRDHPVDLKRVTMNPDGSQVHEHLLTIVPVSFRGRTAKFCFVGRSDVHIVRQDARKQAPPESSQRTTSQFTNLAMTIPIRLRRSLPGDSESQQPSMRRSAARVGACAIASLPLAANASFLPPAMVDTAATYLAWFIIFVVPIGAIVVFWLVHILPEKAAENRHHPQKEAITVLCLLSLVFGGLLWPLAWLWAYTKPIGYRAAYGTDKHDEFFVTMGERAKAGELNGEELAHLREEIDGIEAQRPLGPELREARDKIDAALAHLGTVAPTAVKASAGAE